MKKAIPIQDLLSLIIFGDLIKDNIEFIFLLSKFHPNPFLND